MIPMEAICTGLPTILTPFLGVAEFAKYGIPVKYKMVEADYYEHLKPCGQWAEADIRDLADKMIDVFDHYEEYEERAHQAAIDCAREFTWEKSAAAIAGHLERIWNAISRAA